MNENYFHEMVCFILALIGTLHELNIRVTWNFHFHRVLLNQIVSIL